MPEPSEPKPPARKSQLLELFGIALSGGWMEPRPSPDIAAIAQRMRERAEKQADPKSEEPSNANS